MSNRMKGKKTHKLKVGGRRSKRRFIYFNQCSIEAYKGLCLYIGHHHCDKPQHWPLPIRQVHSHRTSKLALPTITTWYVYPPPPQEKR